MKTKDLARAHDFEPSMLNDYLRNNDNFAKTSTALGGLQVQDGDVDAIVAAFTAYREAKLAADQAKRDAEVQQQRLAREAEAQRQMELVDAAARKKRALAEMLITSGFNFDGYTVVKYSGYISGDDAIEVARGREGIFARATHVGDALMANLTVIRRNALAELKEQAYALGCNAIIGVDFDYLTLDPETVSTQGATVYMPYVFGVTANGNAVVIQKN
ncbi:heavy metal-binding domain-containing protein [Lacticaseibacillus jixiensis]|uniref:heavy metal-binding domain-containing protein n=1 Tax=Lacticaseibacillus jixiensis TaxID=3231926 RepID=UPI0036F2E597